MKKITQELAMPIPVKNLGKAMVLVAECSHTDTHDGGSIEAVYFSGEIGNSLVASFQFINKPLLTTGIRQSDNLALGGVNAPCTQRVSAAQGVEYLDVEWNPFSEEHPFAEGLFFDAFTIIDSEGQRYLKHGEEGWVADAPYASTELIASAHPDAAEYFHKCVANKFENRTPERGELLQLRGSDLEIHTVVYAGPDLSTGSRYSWVYFLNEPRVFGNVFTSGAPCNWMPLQASPALNLNLSNFDGDETDKLRTLKFHANRHVKIVASIDTLDLKTGNANPNFQKQMQSTKEESELNSDRFQAFKASLDGLLTRRESVDGLTFDQCRDLTTFPPGRVKDGEGEFMWSYALMDDEAAKSKEKYVESGLAR